MSSNFCRQDHQIGSRPPCHVIKIAAAWFGVWLCSSMSAGSADTFCVASQTEIEKALEVAATNREDDILQIARGVAVNSVVLPTEYGFKIQIKTGYSLDCSERLDNLPDAGVADTPLSVIINTPGPQQSITGPIPPVNVMPASKSLPSSLFQNATDMTVIGAPFYLWRHGCGPTAVGMVLGYWHGKGCTALFDENAQTQTPGVNQSIASQGSDSSPQHYEDYSMPFDSSTPTILTDKSESSEDQRHANNSVADFMQTSWSSRSNRYGWSWSSDIIPSFTGYVGLRQQRYVPLGQAYYFDSTLTWQVLTAEIDASRPMVFLVDSDGDGWTDHFVTVVGYKTEGGLQYYGSHDTWSADTVRWERFGAMSSNYSWGIWGGWSFLLTCPESTVHLAVIRNGSGRGTVISSPSGINCGSTCTAAFFTNQTVTLTATAEAGSIFTGWSNGNCSGVGACQLMMDMGKNVTANFHDINLLFPGRRGWRSILSQ
jgi:hypothetical protein